MTRRFSTFFFFCLLVLKKFVILLILVKFLVYIYTTCHYLEIPIFTKFPSNYSCHIVIIQFLVLILHQLRARCYYVRHCFITFTTLSADLGCILGKKFDFYVIGSSCAGIIISVSFLRYPFFQSVPCFTSSYWLNSPFKLLM